MDDLTLSLISQVKAVSGPLRLFATRIPTRFMYADREDKIGAICSVCMGEIKAEDTICKRCGVYVLPERHRGVDDEV